MSGAGALQGYRYQFLCSLEYAFTEMMRPNSRLTRLWVESPSTSTAPQRQEIVDFRLDGDCGGLITVQVKSTRVSRKISGPELLRLLVRLIKSGDSEQYLVVTNQQPSNTALEVRRVLSTAVEDTQSLADQLRAAAGLSAEREGEIDFTPIEIARLHRANVHFDDRLVQEVSAAVRDRVRSIRRKSGRRTGAGSAGLLTNHLVGVVLERASQTNGACLTIDELREHASIDDNILAQSWGTRDWGRLSGSPPRLGDIERPELVAQIESALVPQGSSSTTPNCCVLTGPSGIGKSTLAVSYAADFADAYDDVFWVHCSSSGSARAGYETIAQDLTISFDITQTDTQLRNLVHRHMSTMSGTWLLVLDNAESRKVAEFWIPAHGSGGVLITTTDRVGWNGPRISICSVSSMTPDQAYSMVKSRLTDELDETANEANDVFRKVAVELSCWPLALELACNYVRSHRSCGLGIADTKEFLATLKSRALIDDGSVPIGYPHSLIVAIKLVLERLQARSHDDQFAGVALQILRYAAYTSGWQVPIDLLIQCSTFTMKEAVEQNIRGPVTWQSENYPTWEIVRTVERDCLVERGYNIDLGSNKPRLTIGVNEIIRDVVRMETTRQDPTGELESVLVENLAFFTQSWISWFTANDAIDHVRPLMPNARHIADLGLSLSAGSYGLALLWGNLANALLLLEQFEPAEQYLRAELKFLLIESENREVLLVQTLMSLASLLVNRHELQDNPQSEAIPLLEQAASLIARVDPEELTKLRPWLISGRYVTAQMGRHSVVDPRVASLAEVFDVYTRMLPSDNAEPIVRSNQLDVLLRDGDFVGAEVSARQWLGEIGPSSIAFPACLRYLVEALACQRKWDELGDPVAKLRDAVRAQRVQYIDASTAILNSGLLAALCVLTGSPGSARALRDLVDLADEYETLRYVFNAADSACLYALRAADALVRGRMRVFAEFLAKIDFDALRSTDPLRYRGWSDMVEVLNAVADYGMDSELEQSEPPIRQESKEEAAPTTPTVDDDVRYMWADGPEYNPETGEIGIGDHADGTTTFWTLHRKGQGVRNGLVVGPPGTGKTNLLRVLLMGAVKTRKFVLFLIDHADRGGFGRFSNAHKYTASSVEDAEALLAVAVRIVNERNDDGNFPDPTIQFPGILIFVDGADMLFAESNHALLAVESIAENGPRNSIGIILTVEGAGLDYLGGSLRLRDNLAAANKVVFTGPGREV